MLLPILLGFFTAFLALAFALLHLLVSLSELKKGNKTLGIYLLFIGSSLRPSLSSSTSFCQLLLYSFG